MSINHTEYVVPITEGKLFCRIFGDNENSPVIVVHGGPGLSANYLLPQMSALGKFSRAIFYDQRGTGQSITTSTAWHQNPWDTYVSDLHQLITFFNFKSVTLLSHSWGSALISLYGLAHPHHVKQLIYVNPVPVSSKDYLQFVKERNEIVNQNKDKLTAIRESQEFLAGDPTTIEKYYRIYFANYFVNNELANQLNLSMSSQAAINNFKIYDIFYHYAANHDYNLYEKLKSFHKPALIIAADKDIIPFHYTKHLHEVLSASKLIMLKNAGHFPYIDQPQELFKELEMAIL